MMQRGGLFRPSNHPSSFDGITRSVASSIVKAAAASSIIVNWEKSLYPPGGRKTEIAQILSCDNTIHTFYYILLSLKIGVELLKFFLLFFPIFFLQARYTGFRDRPLHERQAKFQQACREGQIELVRKFYFIWKKIHSKYTEILSFTSIWPKTIQTFLNFIGHFIQRIHILFDVERLRKRLFGSSCHDSNRF